MTNSDSDALETKLVHAGETRVDGAVRLPIFQSAMFEYAGNDPRGARYIRYFNTPNQTALSDKLATLEGAEAGLVTASGMGAISSVLLTLLQSDDHFLALESLYGGTHELIHKVLPRFGVTHSVIDGNRPESWAQHVRPNTKAVYVETITNPLLRVPDHTEIVRFCKHHGLTSIIDNTFASPVLFRPPQHGYDISLHSATKYLNGHSDVVAGAILSTASLIATVRSTLHSLGSALDPHAAFLVNRGVNTLAVRIQYQCDSALKVAQFLESHEQVRAVSYPGLESHPDYDRARDLLDGFGGMVSFELKDGLDAAERFLSRVRIPIIAPSLGGPETVMTRPAITSHVGLSADARQQLGIGDGLIRCSIGLESPDDLISDFQNALST